MVSALALSSASAHADDPAIPVVDLPPFPKVDAGSRVSEAAVFGAAQSEEETVVGAAKREQSLGTVASAVTVITADQMRRYGYRTVADAIRGTAGVFIVDDRAVERIGVRGIQLLGDANTRILVLIDGTPLNEPWAQSVDASTALPISLDDVARIEVIRGPVSSLYGTNAFFGIINIVTLEADKGARAYGRTSVDTFGTFGGNAAFNTGTLNRQVRGSVAFAQRGGEHSLEYPELPGQRTSADGAQAYFGAVAVNFDRLFFQLRAYNRERELPGAPYDSAFGDDRNTNRDRQGLAELGYTRPVTDKVTVAARVYGNMYRYDSTLIRTDGTFTTKADALWYGGEVRVLADVLPKKLLGLTTGVSYEQTSTESTASTKPDPIENDFNIAGAYVEATTEPKPWFAATFGIRVDHNSQFENTDSGTLSKAIDLRVSPRAALFLRKGELYGLKLLYSEGFRNPSVLEAFYADDIRFSPAFDAEMRTELRPESITAYEVVAYGRPLTGVKARISAWNWRLADLLKRNEFFDPVLNEVRIRYQNSAKLVSRGVEVEASYRDLAGRHAYLNGALSFTGRNCLKNDGPGNLFLDAEKGNCDERQNAPVIVAQVGASSQLLMDLFHVSGELRYISERGTQDKDVSVPATVGVNIVLYVPNFHGVDLTIGGRNLVKREMVPAQSDYNRVDPVVPGNRTEVLRIPGPGREVFVRAGYRF